MFFVDSKNSINFEVEENLGLIPLCLSGPGQVTQSFNKMKTLLLPGSF